MVENQRFKPGNKFGNEGGVGRTLERRRACSYDWGEEEAHKSIFPFYQKVGVLSPTIKRPGGIICFSDRVFVSLLV